MDSDHSEILVSSLIENVFLVHINATCVRVRQSSCNIVVRFSGIFNPLTFKDKQRILVIVESKIKSLSTGREVTEGGKKEKKNRH